MGDLIVGPWDRITAARRLLEHTDELDHDRLVEVANSARRLLDQAIGDREQP